MRQLHPVSIKERFVASGVYTWAHTGVNLPVREAWTIHELPDQSQIIRVDREDSGSTLLLEILRDAAGGMERFDAHFYGGPGRSIRQAKATFSFFDDRVQVGRTLDNAVRQHDTMTLTPAARIYPQALVLLGTLIIDAAVSGESIPVFSFGLDDSNLFLPQIDDLVARPLAQTLDDDTPAAVIPYQMVYKNYDKNSRFWLDKYRTIVKMESSEADKPTVMTLSAYSRRPETDHD